MTGDGVKAIRLVEKFVARVLRGRQLDAAAARQLLALPAAESPALFWGADAIRRARRGGAGLTCAIMNAKSGACSEDCIYCAQSAAFATHAAVYPMPEAAELVAAARAAQERGADRFSFVTSGRGLGDADIDRLCSVIARLPQEGVTVPVCLSLGILEEAALRKLRAAGAVRYHHNLETSRRHFPAVTTTHTWQDRVDTVKKAQAAGFEVCSGVLLGLGETEEDRIDMALEIRALGVESIPVNFLSPIPGTPAASLPPLPALQALRAVALFRFLNPEKEIRICGGREHCLGDLQSLVFMAGADGIMIGNYLVVAGRSPEADLEMMRKLGIRP